MWKYIGTDRMGCVCCVYIGESEFHTKSVEYLETAQCEKVLKFYKEEFKKNYLTSM